MHRDCADFLRASRRSLQASEQTIPKEFERVIAKLDEYCGEEEFEQARVGIDWMNSCLQNFTKDDKAVSCPMNASYSCAVDAQSEACMVEHAEH